MSLHMRDPKRRERFPVALERVVIPSSLGMSTQSSRQSTKSELRQGSEHRNQSQNCLKLQRKEVHTVVFFCRINERGGIWSLISQTSKRKHLSPQ